MGGRQQWQMSRSSAQVESSAFRSLEWGDSFRRSRLVELVRVREEDEERAWEIIVEYDDKDFSYTDATSFAVAESLDIEYAFALDRHLEQYGRFRILP